MSEQYHHGDLKTTILKKAFEQIQKHGIRSLKLRQLAKEANVSPTAIYRHFKNLDDIIAELSADGFDLFVHYMQQATKNAAEQDKLIQQGIAYVEFALDHPTYFDLMFGQYLEDHRIHPRLLASSEQSYNMLKRFMVDFDEPEVHTQAAWAGVHGIATLMLKDFIPIKANRKLQIKKLLLAT